MKLSFIVNGLSSTCLLIVLGCAAGNTNSDAAAPLKRDLTTADVEGMMTSLSNWGRWGKDDELGALNLITAEKRRQAAELVSEGVSVSLSRNAIKEPVDSSAPFEHTTQVNPTSAGDEYSVKYHGFTQTHMDALCHLFHNEKMYNGYSMNEVTEKGAAKLSVVNFKNGVFTRGVLMDIPSLLGKDYLDGARAIYPEDLDAWEAKSGVRVQKGDAVLIHTGRWTRRAKEGTWEIMQGSAGLHASCLPWLRKRDVAIVGSDLALDVMPSGIEGFPLPVHWVLIVAMGTPILDNMDLEALSAEAARQGRWEFLLTAAPLAVEGGTGSPLNPIATF